MVKNKVALVALLTLAALGIQSLTSCQKKHPLDATPPPQAELDQANEQTVQGAQERPQNKPIYFPLNPHDESFQSHNELSKNKTLYDALRWHNIPIAESYEIIKALRSLVIMRKLASNTTITAFWKNRIIPQLEAVELKMSPLESVVASKQVDGTWHAERKTKTPKKVPVSYSGTVSSSLWESAANAGMKADLIMALTEVFAWQVDFNREVRSGDRWRLVVDQLMVDGDFLGWDSVKIAEYYAGDEKHTGVYFESKDKSISGYFNPEGDSLRKMFLKSPIKFGRVTSKFNNNRFHPILKTHTPHNGVDYGAPTGTPVRTVGNGIVVFAGYNGASGNMIKIRHNSVYTTSYLHLSKLAPGIKAGKKVSQGAIIGFVGATGRTTGPHLHFAFYENGVFVNPQGRKFPSAEPVPQTKKDEFKGVLAERLGLLPNWEKSLTWQPKEGESKQ